MHPITAAVSDSKVSRYLTNAAIVAPILPSALNMLIRRFCINWKNGGGYEITSRRRCVVKWSCFKNGEEENDSCPQPHPNQGVGCVGTELFLSRLPYCLGFPQALPRKFLLLFRTLLVLPTEQSAWKKLVRILLCSNELRTSNIAFSRRTRLLLFPNLPSNSDICFCTCDCEVGTKHTNNASPDHTVDMPYTIWRRIQIKLGTPTVTDSTWAPSKSKESINARQRCSLIDQTAKSTGRMFKIPYPLF